MHRTTVEQLEKVLFTSTKPDESLHMCVVAFDATHAVSCRHGPHSTLKKNEIVTLYSVCDQNMQHKALVHAISDVFDVIVFKLHNEEFSCYPQGLDSTHRGQAYMQLGISPNRIPTWKDGVISEKFVGFCIGTSHGKSSDSGSGIFNSSGYFLGTSIGKKSFALRDFPNLSIGEKANHLSNTQIISSDVIVGLSEIIGPGFEPPEKHRKTNM